MRWLRHISSAKRDAKMQRLRAEFGAEGYGAYWMIVEEIAEQLDGENNETSLTLTARQWCQVADMRPKKLAQFLHFANVLRLFCVQNADVLRTVCGKNADVLLKIDCPKLLKYRDEWTRKKQKTPEFPRARATDTDTEVYISPPTPLFEKGGDGGFDKKSETKKINGRRRNGREHANDITLHARQRLADELAKEKLDVGIVGKT